MKDRPDASMAWCGTPSSIRPMKKERKQAGGQEAEKLFVAFRPEARKHKRRSAQHQPNRSDNHICAKERQRTSKEFSK
jgi:hypothetical protein